MRYYINAENGYIGNISTVSLDGEGNATAEQYEEVKALYDNKPSAPEGYVYLLRASTLDWELVELPPMPPEDEEATTEDYEAALGRFGV